MKNTSIFLFIVSLFFLFTNAYLNNFKYIKTQEKFLDNESENYLYKISDKYFLATDKKLPEKYFQKYKNLKLISNEDFWNPRKCAQMKHFFHKNKIYFFDTLIVSEKENNGSQYLDLLHIFDISRNKLDTLKLNRHLNIYDFGEILEDQILTFIGKDKLLLKYYLDLESLKFKQKCSLFTCEKIEKEIVPSVNKNDTDKILEDKPYGLKIYNKDDVEIFDLDKNDLVYFYLLYNRK